MKPTPINLLFVGLLASCLPVSAQNPPNYEQAYGFFGEPGRIESVEPSFADGQYLLGGQLNNRAMVTRVNGAGQSLDYALLPFAGSTADARVTDIARIDDQSAAAIGLCRGCGSAGDRQSVFITLLDADLNVTSTLILDPDEVQANFDRALIETDGNRLYVAFNDEFFGGSHYLRAYDLNLDEQWAAFKNLAFVEKPAELILGDTSLWMYAEEWNGFGSNIGSRLVEFDLDGNLIKQFPYSAFGKQAALLPDGRFALTAFAQYYPDPAKIRLSIVDPENGAVLDSLLLGGNPNSMSTAMTALSGGNLLLAVRESAFFEDPAVIYQYDPADLTVPVNTLSVIGDQGAKEREILDLLPLSGGGGAYIAVGFRTEMIERGMFLSYSADNIALTPPAEWSNDLCGSALLEDRFQHHYPSVLPWISERVVYHAGAIQYNGQPKDLVSDIYVPFDLQTTGDPAQKRPLLVIMHGGGFIGGNEDGFSNLAIPFAEAGYVTASISYRLGIADGVNTLPDLCTHPNETFAAMYRAVQDLRDAVNFLYDQADTYHIDRENIFVLGHSAGAISVLNCAFLDQPEVEGWSPGLTASLGELPPKPHVKAYISWAGATAAELIDDDDDTPLFFIHGTCDPLVAFNEGTSICGEEFFHQGPFALACRKQALGQPYFLQAINKGDHGMGGSDLAVLFRLNRWLKEENICGSPGQACEVIEALNPLDCPDVPLCPENCVVSAIELQLASDKLSVYPNPASGWVRIELPEQADGDGEVILYNAAGQPVIRENFKGRKIELTGGRLPAGWYVIEIRQAGATIRTKVLFQPS